MKKMLMLSILAMSISSAYAYTTTVGGVTYSCEPVSTNPDPYPPVYRSYYCTIEATFDGTFGGSGSTELEARQNTKAACKAGARNNGFFCNQDSIVCDSN